MTPTNAAAHVPRARGNGRRVARVQDAGPREQRAHERLVPNRPGEFELEILAQGLRFQATILDYSPFGIGALLPADEITRGIIVPGREFPLRFRLGSSEFPSKGRVAGVTEVDDGGAPCLRVGFALVSEGTPTREKLSQRRGELRLEVDEHLSPLCVCEDELWFGERIFMRVLDASASGLALELPGSCVPFIPKQRLWLKLLVPFFGEFKVCARVAYVRPRTSTSGEKSHLVGVTLLRSVADISHILCDWLFFTHPEFERGDLGTAGFDVSHLTKMDDHLRARIVLGVEDSRLPVASGERGRSARTALPDGAALEFRVEDVRGDCAAKGRIGVHLGGGRLEVAEFTSERMDTLVPFLKFLLLLSDVHAAQEVVFLPEAHAALTKLWPGAPAVLAPPSGALTGVPLAAFAGLAPLIRKRLPVPPGNRGKISNGINRLMAIFGG